MRNIILFGPPGAGKGTFAEMLCKENNWSHLNMGQIIRDEINAGTKIGNHAKAIIDAGELLSDKVINEIAKKYVLEAKSDGIVYDGFPRTVGQAKMIDQLLNARRVHLDCVINLDCNLDVTVGRILGRKRDENDTEENAKFRFKVYEKETKPVLNYFDNKGKVITLDGNGTIEEVFPKVKEIL